jgi:hypothetical protein
MGDGLCVLDLNGLVALSAVGLPTSLHKVDALLGVWKGSSAAGFCSAAKHQRRGSSEAADELAVSSPYRQLQEQRAARRCCCMPAPGGCYVPWLIV